MSLALFIVLFSGMALYSIVWLPKLEVPITMDVGLRASVVNEYRRTWAGVFGGLFVLFGSLIALWRTEIARREVRAIEEGQVTERYTRAIDQLGAQNALDGTPHAIVRLGGIYALEQIALDRPEKYYWPIVGVLVAYVRSGAPIDGPKRDRPSEEVQVAIDVIGGLKLPLGRFRVPLDFSRTWLKGANFSVGAWHQPLLFEGSVLDGADFSDVELTGADFTSASLVSASFDRAEISEAKFNNANLAGATFLRARFFTSLYYGESGEEQEVPAADFSNANVTGADFRFVDPSDLDVLTPVQRASVVTK